MHILIWELSVRDRFKHAQRNKKKNKKYQSGGTLKWHGRVLPTEGLKVGLCAVVIERDDQLVLRLQICAPAFWAEIFDCCLRKYVYFFFFNSFAFEKIID